MEASVKLTEDEVKVVIEGCKDYIARECYFDQLSTLYKKEINAQK